MAKLSLINCPECGKEISEKADACPNCGYPINPSNGKSEGKDTRGEKENDGIPFYRRKLFLTPVFIIFVAGLVLFSVIDIEKVQEVGIKQYFYQSEIAPYLVGEERVLKNVAVHKCQEKLKRRLNAPSTAEFESYNDISFRTGERNAIELLSEVSAENALGGRISKTYACRLEEGPYGWETEIMMQDEILEKFDAHMVSITFMAGELFKK